MMSSSQQSRKSNPPNRQERTSTVYSSLNKPCGLLQVFRVDDLSLKMAITARDWFYWYFDIDAKNVISVVTSTD